jgi:hypothetical protein
MCTTGFSETLIAIYQTTLHFYLQYGGISLLQNVDSYLPNCMVSRTRIQFRGTLEVVSLGSLMTRGLVRCHQTEATLRRWSSDIRSQDRHSLCSCIPPLSELRDRAELISFSVLVVIFFTHPMGNWPGFKHPRLHEGDIGEILHPCNWYERSFL